MHGVCMHVRVHTHIDSYMCTLTHTHTQAIALSKLIESGGQMDEVTESMSGFYLLKYGTHDPQLSRVDSSIRHLKYHTTRKQFKTIAEVGVRNGGKEGEEEEEGGWKAEAGEGSERDKKEEELQRQSSRASKHANSFVDMIQTSNCGTQLASSSTRS